MSLPSDSIFYMLNGAAVGDLVAAAPSVKWAMDRFHGEGGADYRVGVFPEFRELFSFVPDDKIIDLNAMPDVSRFAIRKLNLDGGGGNVVKLTPSHFSLVHYAAIGLLNRLPDPRELRYIPLPEVPVDHFGIDWDRAVVMSVTYRDKVRTWAASEILKTAQYIQDKGLQPVYVGRTGGISIWKTLAMSDFEYPGYGVDLRNQTTLLEMATVMKKSRVVIGMDSGPVHVAWTTETPVICGFTNVSPELRIPYRPVAKTVAVTPNPSCRFCQSDWSLDFFNFSNACPRKMENPICTQQMTADLFCKALDHLLSA
jgi:hypothetical protein